jgi:hypothetical protein
MTFQWKNLSKGLSKELARPVGLRVSFAAEDLSAKFGELPTDALVEDLWPTLRERWLATRPASRERVVAELRKAGLGDTAIKIGSKAGQMEYLRSCRQSGRLKAIVLAAFLAEGSQPMMAPSVMVGSSTGIEPPEPGVKDDHAALEATQITRPDQVASPPSSELRQQVAAIVTELTGSPPIYDDDGDIPIGLGSARLFLRVLENDVPVPMIRMFGRLVQGVKPTSELLVDLNEANRQFFVCRLTFVDGNLLLDGCIPAVGLTVHELAFLLDEALNASDHFDTLFVARHGGALQGPDSGEVVDV